MGTIPDLDVLTAPFVLEWQQLALHRGFSHSIFFPFLVAPLIGWLLFRFHGKEAGADWRGWSWLAFWGILTHPILDAFTVYGTQLLNPLSNYPFAFNSIFIIDLLYTVPLIFGILVAMRRPKDHRRRRLANNTGLTVSTAYLLLTVLIKLHVNSQFEATFVKNDYQVDHYMTAAMPLNSLLWMGVASDSSGYWVGTYSIFDDKGPIDLQRIERRDYLLDSIRDEAPVQRLLWFSKGYYTVSEENGSIIFGDLRFGRTDNFLTGEGGAIFRFRLVRDPADPQQIVNFKQYQPGFRAGSRELSTYFARVFGTRPSNN